MSFLVPLDPDDLDGLKLKEEIKKLSNTDFEEVFTFLLMFNEKVDDLDIPKRNIRFRIFERLLSEHVKREWMTVRLDYDGQGMGQDIFDQYVSSFTTLDTKEWMSEIRKPREWRMQQLLARVKMIYDLFIVILIPEGEHDTIPKLTDNEFKVILKKAVPKSWTNK